MEDGFPLFDPNDEAARQEQRLREYYEEFSANARKRLLSKVVNRPTSVYDVLYPKTRTILMSKNTPINNNLEESAKLIRDGLIAKLVDKETDLEKISSDFRKSMLAREKIQEDREKLMRDGGVFRKNLISKNSEKRTNLEKDSQQARSNNVHKNKLNPSIQDNIDKNSSTFRDAALTKNASKDQNLLKDSEEFKNRYRKNDIHKNVSIDTSLKKNSEAFRLGNLAKNIEGKKQNVDEISKTKREEAAAKNSPKESSSEEDSKVFRNDDLSKNFSKDQDLLRDSENIRTKYREKDLNRNVPSNSDIERDNKLFRKGNLSKNKAKFSDLEEDSGMYRNNSLSQNTTDINKAGIEEIGDSERSDELSKNKPIFTDLEKDSSIFRKDDISSNASKSSDLEKDSKIFRSDELSKNKPNISDLETDSVPFRSNDLSTNKPSASDLEEDSAAFRSDDLSLNKSKNTNLEIDSVPFRSDDLSMNKPSFTDLESDSVVFRNNDLSFNKQNLSDLEVDSVPFRSDDLSLNKPSFTDLKIDSVVFRDDDLSLNAPNISDLETDSVSFRDDDLAANNPSVSDLETDSVSFRDDDLAANTPSISDLIVDSTPFLFGNVSANVPSDSDLETDSVPFRNDDLSTNVISTGDLLLDSESFRNDDLSTNTPSSSNLVTDSVVYRTTDLAANVHINTDISSNSIDFRDDSLSKNNPLSQNLLTDSTQYRDSAKAKNEGLGLLGVSVNGAGTSAFLGISRVFTQGIILRQLLISKNVPKQTNLELDSKVFRDNSEVQNKWRLSDYEYTSTNENLALGRITQGSINTNLVDYSSLQPYSSPTSKAIFATDDFIVNKGREIQGLYGTSQKVDFPTERLNREINDALYSVNTALEKGGQFLDYFFKRQTYTSFKEGVVTSTIRNYIQERSTFNLNGLQVGDPNSKGVLEGIAQDGFQDLISKTIGSFKANSQPGTNTTPASVVVANGGTYVKGGNNQMDLLRPAAKYAPIGTAESMMGKTTLGNPYADEDFLLGKRGVKHVVNTIKDSNQPLAANFDTQNNRAYIIGANRDGSPKVSRQRYTIANPYAPSKAGHLIFFIKNYASQEQFYFPPYIQSIQNTENASWNSHNFLGRPEAVYTYNNSSRDASISFYVLTDYAQTVDVGRDWKDENMRKVTANISRHFTEKDNTQSLSRKKKIADLKKKQEDDKKNVKDAKEKVDENIADSNEVKEKQGIIERAKGKSDETRDWASNKVANAKARAAEKANDIRNKRNSKQNATDQAELDAKLKVAENEAANSSRDNNSIQAEIDRDFNSETNYSESSGGADNVYNINVIKKEFINGETVCKPGDTIKRINTMKRTLMFQPSFFSGDKVDFVRKVEFLSKLTRPSANNSKTGFSFTNPPVCHIHLGDWWNHDIIVNSVSFDYADAPWTLDGGRVQPMWALVSINFNIIGPYKSFSARPPLADDVGGMYSPIDGITRA